VFPGLPQRGASSGVVYFFGGITQTQINEWI